MEAKEGSVLAVLILNNKRTYNKIELVSGRNVAVSKGDIVVVTLGQRKALRGYVGALPKKLKKGDILNILNIGGITGVCTDRSDKEVGAPFKAQILGAVVDKNEKPINIKDYKVFKPADKIISNVPVIAVSGTCMNTGKTSVCAQIARTASRRGLKVMCAKVAGIAAIKDTGMMLDLGAEKAVSIIDAGFSSTVDNHKHSVSIAKGAINYLSKSKPDLIIMELGDGILGDYGVEAILKDPEIQKITKVHIGCAVDQPGALKLFEIAKKIGLPLDLISGPVTDNSVGTLFIEKATKIPAINALSKSTTLFELVEKKI